MRGGAAQGIVNAVEVVLRIGLYARVPAHFFAEDHFAVDDGGAFAIARAQVETDAAAVQVAAQRRGSLAFHGRVFVGSALDGQRLAVNALAHKFVIEGAHAARTVDAAQIVGRGARRPLR